MEGKVLWTKEEAEILLDALIEVKSGFVDRKVAIEDLSNRLRQRAIDLGKQIDDKYRNVAGIDLQMSIMEYILTNGAHGLRKMPPPHLFEEVVNEYKINQESDANLYRPSLKEAFIKWLSVKAVFSKTDRKAEYIDIYKDLEKYCLKKGVLKTNLLKTDDLSTIYDIINIVQFDKNFKLSYKQNFNKLFKFICFYYSYLKNAYVPNERTLKSEKGVLDNETVDILDFSGKNNLYLTKPVSYKYKDQETIKCSNWRNLYVDIAKALAREYPSKIYRLINKPLLNSGIDFCDKLHSRDVKAAEKIGADLYLGTSHFTSGIVKRIKYLLDYCGVDYNKLIVFYKKGKREVKYPVLLNYNTDSEVKKQDEMNTVELDFRNNTDKANENNKGQIQEIEKSDIDGRVCLNVEEKYSVLLETYFAEDGYKFGSYIFQERLKVYYFNEYGQEPQLSSDEAETLLKKIGTVRDSRVFPKQNKYQDDLIAEIISDVFDILNQGISAVYVDAVFDKYKTKLADHLQIYDSDVLASVIMQYAQGKFIERQACFMMPDNNIQTNIDVLRIVSEYQEPMTIPQIHEEIWFVTESKLKGILQREKSIVFVAEGTCFYAPNLPINADELNKIVEMVSNELSYRDFITEKEFMKLIETCCPSFVINTEGMTSYGIRDCLGYLLKDVFNIKGPVITNVGNELASKDIYSSFARSHESFTFDELKELSEELNIGIYWDSVLTESIRITETEFVNKQSFNFDVEAIDEALEIMCYSDFVPLRDVNLFLYLPNVGYQWSSFLLEGYLYNFSKKFKLIHSSFTQSGVFGAMVRQDSKIMDYRSLIVNALARSGSLESINDAIQFVVDQGYQQRRRFDGIESLIKDAKFVKNKIEKK